MYKTLLLATDLMEGSRQTALKAKQLASELNATLHILHVIEPPASEMVAAALGFAELPPVVTDAASLALNALADELGIPQEQQHLEVGVAHKKIIEQITKTQTELLLINSHSHTPLAELLGTTANALTHHSPCSILIVK